MPVKKETPRCTRQRGADERGGLWRFPLAIGRRIAWQAQALPVVVVLGNVRDDLLDRDVRGSALVVVVIVLDLGSGEIRARVLDGVPALKIDPATLPREDAGAFVGAVPIKNGVGAGVGFTPRTFKREVIEALAGESGL